MALTAKFIALVASATAAVVFATPSLASPATLPAAAGGAATPSNILTWLSTTDAKVTFVNGPTADVGADVMVVACTTRSGDQCGGACIVYNGGTTCLDAPGTNCLMASQNVEFCDQPRCGGTCTELSACVETLEDGFCYTPGTESVFVPFITPPAHR